MMMDTKQTTGSPSIRWIDEVKKDLIKAIIVAEKLNPRDKADLETIEMRKRACESCVNNIDGECRICKCLIDIKTETKVNFNIKKMKYELTHCPLGLWEDALIVNLIKTIK